jgi:ATP-binding cassette, subfamily B, bacterial
LSDKRVFLVLGDSRAAVAHGRIAEIGSHEELLRREGIYAELFSVQAKGYR